MEKGEKLRKQAERPRKDEEGEEGRQETVGQCIITTVYAWDYPLTQHTVKSLSFDILETFGRVYFRAQEILRFLSGNEAAWIYRNRALLGLTTSSYC